MLKEDSFFFINGIFFLFVIYLINFVLLLEIGKLINNGFVFVKFKILFEIFIENDDNLVRLSVEFVFLLLVVNCIL